MQRYQKEMIIGRVPDADLSFLNRIEDRSQVLLQELRANRNRADRNGCNGERLQKGQRDKHQSPNMNSQDSKKLRRKLNKKKKHKRIRMLRQGINELKAIFDKIYYMGHRFEELKEELVIALQKIPNGVEFKERLNQLIREYVEETCEYLWDEESRIIANIQKQNETLRGSIDLQKLEAQQARRHKIDFITAIYEEYYVIKVASEDIDKIIELYYEIDSASKGKILDRRPVYKSTFNYMMNHELKLKVELLEASSYLNQEPYRDQEALGKLKEMLQVIYEGGVEAADGHYSIEQSTIVDAGAKPVEPQKPACKHKITFPSAFAEQIPQLNNLYEEIFDHQLIALMHQSEFKNRLDCTFEESFLWAVERFMNRK